MSLLILWQRDVLTLLEIKLFSLVLKDGNKGEYLKYSAYCDINRKYDIESLEMDLDNL